ncbi:uncharacterized protein LOC130430428 isoform X1 [Triplophysa dalaica]|uniref:uncharacterized protein LOC130430428 isoform X1 n=1 Tax=Triplophysa dalaica TaxID=1582913 RepID=UPI0024DF9931|nr:uncharacterized protein LOC130430428 isoform X1 [Triplophysa dalaica]
MDGHSVTLHTDLTHIQTDDVIQWRFGVNGPLIAKMKRSVNINPTYEDNDKTEIFRDRLKMNTQTGDLTITHITSQHSGLYHLNKNIGNKHITKNFKLTVYAPTAVSISESTQTPSSSSSSESSADVYPPSAETHSHYTVVISCAAVAGSLMVLGALLMFFIFRKHRKTHEEVQTREDDVIYTVTTFYKRDEHIKRVKKEEDDDVVYTDVVIRP